MTIPGCESIRDQLPDLASGRLDAELEPGRAHLTACVECRAELEVVELLRRTAPIPAVGLEQRVLQSVRRPRRRFWTPQVMSVAATIAAALIGGTALFRMASSPLDVDARYAAETLVGGFSWSQPGDPLLLMSPGLHALSADELEALLMELES
jgi:hypothetical protein